MKQKNPIQIVRTLATLKDIPWECTLLGDGPLREDVKNEIARHNLQDRFTLPGWVTSEEVVDWFDKSDILFMPSLSEGLPVVGVQALAMGLAMVVSNIGGFVDLVNQGKNGFLIDTPDDYEKGLHYLLTDLDNLIACRRESRLHAEGFSLERIVLDYEVLLGEKETTLSI